MSDNLSGPGTPITGAMASATAAGLSYLLGFVTGIIFLVSEKRDPLVRFSAAQSVLLSVASIAVWIAFSIVAGFLVAIRLWFLLFPLGAIIRLALFGVWLWVMIRAFQGRRVALPLIGDMAQRLAGR